MAAWRARGLMIVAFGIAAPLPASASPPGELLTQSCELKGGSCQLIPKTWRKKSPKGDSGGTYQIESVYISPFYQFTSRVTVVKTPIGEKKSCVMNFSQHLDVGSASDLGFDKKSTMINVTTSPSGYQGELFSFSGGASREITDPKMLGYFQGEGSRPVTSVIDLSYSKTTDGLPCTWSGIESKSIDGSITVTYRKFTLYSPMSNTNVPDPPLPPTPNPKNTKWDKLKPK